ncbi:hypothetical protein ACOCGL_003449 [Vibrio cholerae]
MSSLELVPGMGLNLDEMAVLSGHAQGIQPEALSMELNLTMPQMKLIEQDIRHKLHAHTPMHMISRAFELGILRMMLIAICFSVVTDIDDQALRNRTRTRSEYSRTVRSGREMHC